MQKIMGTVKKTKKVSDKGGAEDSLVVQLKTQNEENMVIVDLGTVEKLKNVDLHVGNRITAWGRLVNIGDERVFMAHRLRTNDGTVDIERESSSSDP